MQLLQKCQAETAMRSRCKFRFKSEPRSLDGGIIELSSTIFDWARYRQRKGAIKLHLLLDHDGHLPSFAVVTFCTWRLRWWLRSAREGGRLNCFSRL
jgi:hypothetical protein